MRTRRSWRNQDRLYNYLSGPANTPKQALKREQAKGQIWGWLEMVSADNPDWEIREAADRLLNMLASAKEPKP